MRNKLLLGLIGVMLAVLIGIGGMIIFSLAISGWRAVVYTDNVNIDHGVVNYLAAYHKLEYLDDLYESGINAYDGDLFWKSKNSSGVKYGDDFEESLRQFITETVAAADIYTTSHGYTSEDRLSVAYKTDEILALYAEGSVSLFNSLAEPYGFDYNDFQNASALLYKASRAKDVAFGDNGKNLSKYPALCQEYLQNYSSVSLFFLYSEETYATDEAGNYMTDESGEYLMRPLTEEELHAREEQLERLRAAIEDGSIGIDMLTAEDNSWDTHPKMQGREYYFNPASAVTEDFAAKYDDIVSLSMIIDLGEIRMVELADGVCFIYKNALSDEGYNESDNPFLADFFEKAAIFHYPLLLEQTMTEVKFKSSYEFIFPLDIPVLNDFYVRSFEPTPRLITPDEGESDQ